MCRRIQRGTQGAARVRRVTTVSLRRQFTANRQRAAQTRREVDESRKGAGRVADDSMLQALLNALPLSINGA